MNILIDTKVFYLEGDLQEDRLYIDLFHINPEYKGKKLSYLIWYLIQNKYKVNIYLLAFFTLIPYYEKMGFEDLGIADNEGYHDFVLKYKNIDESLKYNIQK